MEFNEDKVDKMTLALMYLTTFKEKLSGQEIIRTWKGYDWDILNRFYEKGFIGDPVGKAKSVILTEEGAKLSEKLFEEYFCK